MMTTCFAAYASLPTPREYHGLFESAFFATFQEPVSYAEAMRSSQAEQWKLAMDEESSAFFKNQTWEIVDIDSSWNLLSSKWVFKIKRDQDGKITRYRARLVAKGFLQREGVDFGDVFAPVVRYSTLRVVLALAAHYGLYKRHLDCPKAFTQATLDVPCYMKPPPGIKIPRGKCLKLLKSIYGLKQAGRLFNTLLISFLLEIGFIACPTDTCLLYQIKGDDFVLLAVYVDDLLMCSTTEEIADTITAQLADKFNVTSMGEITWVLGMRITTSSDRHTISLDLHRYIQNIIARYEFDSR